MKAVSTQAVSCCVYVKPPKIMQQMQEIIPCMFDCWVNPVVHLRLLKSSMALGSLQFGFGSLTTHEHEDISCLLESSWDQCAQWLNYFFQYLAIYNLKNCPMA